MKSIVVASNNEHKIREFKEILGGFGFQFISKAQAGVGHVEVVEDGETFEENSYKKAYEIMKASGEISIADDSGLVVDCLDGAPGVYSARFSGREGDDKANNEKLISLLKDVPFEERSARFVAVVTVVWPDGSFLAARGEVEGHMVTEEKGSGGFGYDPLFVPVGYDKTFGEFSAEEKNSISHRGKALRQLRQMMLEKGNA